MDREVFEFVKHVVDLLAGSVMNEFDRDALVQELAIAMWRESKTRSRLTKGFVLQRAKWLMIQRKRPRAVRFEVLDTSIRAVGTTPSKRVFKREVLDLVDGLPTGVRSPVSQYYLEGRGLKEIAAKKGISHVAVWKRIRAGLESLREEMVA